MKDNFSQQAKLYAKFRPSYSPAFFDYLNAIIPNKENAWDCGTGNGQIAFELSRTFSRVFATDISQAQIDNALKADNIFYSIQPAEKTTFNANSFDLIIAGQAVHWFDFEKFYAEVRRTAKQNTLLVLVGYGRIDVSEPINQVIDDFYFNKIGKYWDTERRYIDEAYQTIPFPFEEIQTPSFTSKYYWSVEHLIGYLNTWSAVKHFKEQNGYNPTEHLKAEIENLWETENLQEVRFPMLLRVGRVG